MLAHKNPLDADMFCTPPSLLTPTPPPSHSRRCVYECVLVCVCVGRALAIIAVANVSIAQALKTKLRLEFMT